MKSLLLNWNPARLFFLKKKLVSSPSHSPHWSWENWYYLTLMILPSTYLWLRLTTLIGREFSFGIQIEGCILTFSSGGGGGGSWYAIKHLIWRAWCIIRMATIVTYIVHMKKEETQVVVSWCDAIKYSILYTHFPQQIQSNTHSLHCIFIVVVWEKLCFRRYVWIQIWFMFSADWIFIEKAKPIMEDFSVINKSVVRRKWVYRRRGLFAKKEP